MHELHPALMAELVEIERVVKRRRLSLGLTLIAVGTIAILAGFVHAVGVGGLDAISTILGVSLFAGILLPRGATMVDQVATVNLAQRQADAD